MTLKQKLDAAREIAATAMKLRKQLLAADPTCKWGTMDLPILEDRELRAALATALKAGERTTYYADWMNHGEPAVIDWCETQYPARILVRSASRPPTPEELAAHQQAEAAKRMELDDAEADRYFGAPVGKAG